MKKTFLYSALLICSLATGAVSVAAFSYAAYLNANQYELPIDANTVNISSMFSSGGSGTSAAPFLISTSADLRTLQKLNVLGVFSSTTYFRMNNDITYSGDALVPIGNEDYPFYSQFDGYGYKLINLVVNGANTNDIGMFGFVALGGSIKNLILQSPTVNVTANNVGSTTSSMSAHPMYSILNTAGTNIGNLTFTNATPARFTVPRTTVTGTDNATYSIVYQSTNTSLLYESSSGVWTCGQPNTSKPTTLYPVSLIARVFALYNNQIISYTLERWQINVKGNGTVEVGSSTVNPGWFKCVHNTTYPHETYVGLFVGHLDGSASFLGMYGANASGTSNGKITVNGRNARSYSCLIGYKRSDNPLDDSGANMDQTLLDFNEIIPANGLDGTSYSVYEGNNPITNYTTQYNRAISATTAYGLSAAEASLTRFYPNLSNTHVNYTNPGGGTDTYYVQRITNALGVGTREEYLRYRFLFWYTYDWFGRDATMRNGLWLWLDTTNSSVRRFTRTSTTYEVSVSMDFIANSASTSNYFQIMYNRYNPNLTENSNTKYDLVANDHWVNLGTSYQDNVLIYDPSLHPVVKTQGAGTTSGVLRSETLSFTVNTSSSFWSGSNYFPLIAIGVGKNTPVETDNDDSSSVRYNYDDFVADTFELNIIRMDIRFTSKDGDVSSQTSNIDFLYSMPTRSTDFVSGTYVAWNEASNVKVQMNVSNYNQNTAGTVYRFYRELSSNPLYTYVHGLYTSTTSFPLTNTADYEEAVLAGF